MASRSADALPWRVAFAIALVVTLALALRPAPPGEPWFSHADKVGHVLAFALLGWLGARSGLPRWPLTIGLLAYGGAIELLQGLTPTREPSWADWAADAAGLAIGVWGGAQSFSGRARGAPS
jgi:VanZ family protein